MQDEFHFKETAFINDQPGSSHGGTRAIAAAVTDPDGVGIIEKCYFEGGKANNIIYVNPDKHRGS